LIEVELINDARAHLRKVEADIYAIMITTDDHENQLILEDIANRRKAFDEDFSKISKLPLDEKQTTAFNAIKAELESSRVLNTKVLDLAKQNKNAEAYALFSGQAKNNLDKLTMDLYTLSGAIANAAEIMHKQSALDFEFAKKTFLVIGLLSLILGISLGWLIAKQISTRLNDIVNYIGVLAKGDFSHGISKKSLEDKSEFGTVSRAIDEMKNHINVLIKQLAYTAQQMAASSEELTANADQSAQASAQVAETVTAVAFGAENQLKLADAASAVVSQISTAINQVASNAEIVSGSAEKTTKTANNGEEAIKKAVKQMITIEEKTNQTSSVIGDLENKSKQIGEIVDVIANIAGQTNLLALNAAIEAARAGDAGRGFSVVAEEVRKLAEQSQDAAKKITELIKEVQMKTNDAVSFMSEGKKEVDAGTKVVSTAGENFEEILTMVRGMTNEVHEISAAIEEITSGAQNVVISVEKIDNESKQTSEKTQTISAATEEQSASVEEIASASRHLAQMAEELQTEVHKFKI
jgi:methyl-accepting chemotaxis protein